MSAGPGERESAGKAEVAEEDIGNALSFGSGQPCGDEGVGVGELAGNNHRPA